LLSPATAQRLAFPVAYGTVCTVNVTWPFPHPDTVVLSGDWHGDTNSALSALARAERVGSPVVLQLGDFGMWPGASGKKYLDDVNKRAVRAGVVIAFIDGNHEDFPQLYSYPVDSLSGLRRVRENVLHIPRGSRWVWHGQRFLALGGATSLDRCDRTPMVNWWAEEEITMADAYRATAGGQCDVLLTHDAPAHIPVPLTKGLGWPRDALVTAAAHRILLRDVCDVVDPSRVFHGHFHVRYTATITSDSGRELVARGLGANIGPTSEMNYTLDLVGAPSV
jgi:hypothetical protein